MRMSQKILDVPNHVTIIPDGNRRWARRRGLKPWVGHIRGIGDFAENIAWTALDMGVRYLTVWVGSHDNLTKRSRIEIKMLNKAYRIFIEKVLSSERVYRDKIVVRFLGELNVLEKETIRLIKKVEAATRNHNGAHLTVLLAYSGDREMVAGFKKLARSKKKITDKAIRDSIWTGSLPPVDFIIRTGVENDPHNSAGFMMWLTKNSQLYYSEALWPAFTKEDFKKAIREYQKRERRHGK